jgi:hypothetical protein
LGEHGVGCGVEVESVRDYCSLMHGGRRRRGGSLVEG